MAKNILGGWAEITAWVSYLLLFYCLLAAYIAGGSDILHGLLTAANINTSVYLDAILFTLLLGMIVINGIKIIDYTNRGLMFVKLITFLLLVILVALHVDVTRLAHGNLIFLIPAITVVVTSYGFSPIIPSLCSYFHQDVKILRKVILIGSLIPLICYIAWVMVIFGGLPFDGEYSLTSIANSDHATLALSESLIHHLQNPWVTTITRIFTSICMVTSFLGVSLCVVDFLADGFRLEKKGGQNIILHVATFLPPLIIALVYPTAFIIGLSYAGICIAILMMILPAFMVWKGRYIKKIPAAYHVVGGKIPIIIIILLGVIVIAQGLFWPAT